MMERNINISYIPAVDHLRAYAAILVLFFHSVAAIYNTIFPSRGGAWPLTRNPLMAVIHEGHTGVALFLVLSGFIFTHATVGRKLVYFEFLRNRLLRIYPLLLTMIFIGVSAFPQKFTMSGFLCLVLPLQNTPGASKLGTYTNIVWTIAVELQFYLIFPFLHWVLSKRGCVALLLLLLFTMLARLSAVLEGCDPREVSYWTILGRLDQFLIGMMVAVGVKYFTTEEGRLRWCLPAGGVGLLMTLYVFHRLGGWPKVAMWKIMWPPVEGIFWGAIIAGYLSFFHDERKSILSRLVASIGRISYSMYLIHPVIINIVVKYSFYFHIPNSSYMGPLLSTLTIVLPITMIVSCLSYHAIEKPFLEFRHAYLAPNNTDVKEHIETLSEST